MDITIQKRNAKKFIENWKDRGHEKKDSQSFWIQLLRDVLGIGEPEQFIKFEKKVQLSHESYIDGYIDQTHVMIEQKGSNKDLDKGIKQSDGSLLTPFQQAQ
ncbi:methylase, partial [Pediococcus acidilactici]